MSIAQNLKQRRKELNMSQIELSDESGVSQAQISNIEKGERPNPGVITIQKLATALKTSVDELIK